MKQHHVVVCGVLVFGALIVGLAVGRSLADEDWQRATSLIPTSCRDAIKDAILVGR